MSSNVFKIQQFSKDKEDKVIKNNMTIDFYFGNLEILEDFVERHPDFKEHLDYLKKLKAKDLKRLVQSAKKKSLLITAIMFTGKCNANCPICYTDRKAKANELTVDEIKNIIDQTKKLGSEIIYIPGEGEPLLQSNLWDILNHAKLRKMKVILFTNGILLSNDELSLKQWGLSSEELVKELLKYPVYIYHKFWSTEPYKVLQTMGIDKDTMEFKKIKFNGKEIFIPKGLFLLLKIFPKNRVGVETVIAKWNQDEIIETIIPFIKKTGISSFIEPIIHAGRVLGIFSYDPDSNVYEKIDNFLARKKCRRLGYKTVIHNDGYLSFGIAIHPLKFFPDIASKMNIRENGNIGNIKDIFNMLHTIKPLVVGRYQIDTCICEKLNLCISRGQKAQCLDKFY